MNWNKLHASWEDFAAKNDVKLQYNEQNLLHALKCTYEVNVLTDISNTQLIGILWKSQHGDNRNYTKIFAEFKIGVSEKSLDIKNHGLKKFFNKAGTNETKIHKILSKINGKTLLFNDSQLEIELNGILSSPSEFEEVIELINVIENYK